MTSNERKEFFDILGKVKVICEAHSCDSKCPFYDKKEETCRVEGSPTSWELPIVCPNCHTHITG